MKKIAVSFSNVMSRFSHKHRLVVFSLAFGLIGASIMYLAFASIPLVLDSTLPVPQNLKAYSDDRSIVVNWDAVSNSRVVGYYVTYRPKGSNEEFKVRQTEHTSIQLQPLTNGKDYEIYVQSASGGEVRAAAGGLVYDGVTNVWRKADGKVSNKSVASYATASDARVEAMRTRLTGFFDDFNIPAGPMEEQKWNQAANGCAEAGSAAAFVNDQFHTHNMVGSDLQESFCDRSGIVSRPRATFDMSAVSENAPGQIEFDIDGASHPRDTWYLDVIPSSARTNGLPVDMTSHDDLFDADTKNPGNMLRFNGHRDALSVAYYDNNQNPTNINLYTAPTNCAQSWAGNGSVRYESCSMDSKVSGFSPLQESTANPAPIPNVRRHWVIQMTPTKVRVYIDSSLVAVANMPSSFFAAKKYTLQSTVFSYNTGKIDGNTEDGNPVPSVELIHWDNFGFNGPAPNEVIYNYLEGGATGKNPAYGKGDSNGYRIPAGSRKTIVPIPDPIGNLVNNQARLFYTTASFDYGVGNWKNGDHVLVNGTKYAIPDPATQMSIVPDYIAMNKYSVPFAIMINKSDLKQGTNTIEFKFADQNIDFINVHLELPYSKNDTAKPSYTAPMGIFGATFDDVMQPPMTNCDQYRYVEQDLGLPYQTGKENISTGGACVLMPKGAHNHTSDTSGGSTPVDVVAPTVNLTAPSNGAVTSGATLVASATASDNVGVTRVEFFLNGALNQTVSASPYTANLSISGLSNGSYQIYARAYDSAGNATSSTTVNITVSNSTSVSKFQTLAVGATLPSGSECSTRVRPAAEIRSANATPNHTKGIGGNYYYSRVAGDYTGTTDEIIQWAACKWGMDEDMLRAQMAQESYWHQSAIGDFTTTGSSCSPVYPIANYPAQYNGDALHNNQCPESVGMSQVRWLYHKSAFYKSTNEIPVELTNNAIFSTAYNVDYYGAVWRSCFNGEMTWLNTVERGADYVSGDAYGCMGVWFAGRWRTSPALSYIDGVQQNLATRIWETPAFINAQPLNTMPTQTPLDSTAPTISITTPTTGQSVSGTVNVAANASDAGGNIANVSFYLDGSGSPFSIDTSSPYGASWNSATVGNGSHSIVAKATDTSGNVGVSSAITFTVNNVVADTTKPTAAITSPATGATLSGVVTINTAVADNVGVASVVLLIDGMSRATDTTSPYSFSWDTSGYTDGAHALQITATDAAGNTQNSSILTVTVKNQTAAFKAGDVNGDGLINNRDLSIVLSNWGRTPATRSQGDLNNDSVVNNRDLSIVLSNWGK